MLLNLLSGDQLSCPTIGDTEDLLVLRELTRRTVLADEWNEVARLKSAYPTVTSIIIRLDRQFLLRDIRGCTDGTPDIEVPPVSCEVTLAENGLDEQKFITDAKNGHGTTVP